MKACGHPPSDHLYARLANLTVGSARCAFGASGRLIVESWFGVPKRSGRVAGVVWGKTDLGPDGPGSLELVGFAWRALNEKRQRIASGLPRIFGGRNTPNTSMQSSL